MKIIKQGNLEKIRRPVIFKCHNCGCEFEADNTEYEYAGTQYNEAYYQCFCPCCKTVVLS